MALRALVVAFAMVLVAAPRGARAETVAPAKDPTTAAMRKILDAIKADDYDLFVEAAPRLRHVGKTGFEGLHDRYGAMLLKGYKTTYLGDERKGEHVIRRWKLEPAAAAEDFQVSVVVREAEVAAFTIEPLGARGSP